METKTRSNSRRKMLAIILGLLVFALTAASAATLGGINAAQLGADAEAITSCDTDSVTADYTYAFVAGEYEVATVELSGIATPACDGQDIEVTLFDGSDVALGDVADTVSGATLSVDFSAENILAEDVEGIAIVISG